jgi:hypothetical protein
VVVVVVEWGLVRVIGIVVDDFSISNALPLVFSVVDVALGEHERDNCRNDSDEKEKPHKGVRAARVLGYDFVVFESVYQ